MLRFENFTLALSLSMQHSCQCYCYNREHCSGVGANL